MDRRAWGATVQEVRKSWTQLSNFHFHCFLVTTPRVQATTDTKKDNLVYSKIKNICGSKDTLKKVKEQFTEWKKMFIIIYLKYTKNSYNSIMGKKIT